MRGNRSCSHIVPSALSIKTWLGKEIVDVEDVRPACCPACGIASRESGKALAIHGHGVRSRHVVGPLEPGGEPVDAVASVRRYLCLNCGAVITVVPREVIPGRLYLGPAIAFALALFGVGCMSDADVESKVSPARPRSPNGPWRFRSLRRWCREVRVRRLFPQSRAPPEDWSYRQVAERAAMTLAASSPPERGAEKVEHQAWYGAAHAVMGGSA